MQNEEMSYEDRFFMVETMAEMNYRALKDRIELNQSEIFELVDRLENIEKKLKKLKRELNNE